MRVNVSPATLLTDYQEDNTMKYAMILGISLFTGVAMAGEGWHKFSSSDNPHAKGGCASKKDKMAQLNKFHGKDFKKHSEMEKKVDTQESKKEPKLEDFI